MRNLFRRFIILLPILAFITGTYAADQAKGSTEEEKSSPWLITPLVSSDPKLGTTLGAMAAYMHSFDKESPVSMFGAVANYSDTKSYTAALFANTYFNQDRQRLLAVLATGKINNKYSYERDDGNESVDLRTDDDISMAFIRFSQRVYGEWFIGGQFTNSNYIISAGDDFSNGIIELLDLTGFDSSAIGLVVTHDTRDNQQSASTGHNFVLNNLAYRKSLGGDESFDSYMFEYSQYFPHGDGSVLGLRIKGRWTNNAPSSGFSSMQLRGYVRGQYLAAHSTFIELDERFALNDRWGLTAFTGIGCLYGDKLSVEGLPTEQASCSDSEDIYPAAGAGVLFTIKPEEKMVIRAEFAVGKRDNRGFYLNFGQPF